MAADEHKEPKKEHTSKNGAKNGNSIAERRGRMVAAGGIAAVLLSVIAVLVAAIFQYTAELVAPCPRDLPVNDPAPKLWNQVVSQQIKSEPLGIPDALKSEARFKGLPPAGKKSGKKTTSRINQGKGS